MKRVLLLLTVLLTVSIHAYEIQSLVSDYADILGVEKGEIESRLAAMKEAGVAEFAVVTVPSLEGRDVEGYAFELAEGVLGDEEKNNGLLLLIAVEDRKWRFEVGRGLEPVLPDIVVGRIGREYLTPHFREGNYGKGVLEGVKIVEQLLGGAELPPEQAGVSVELTGTSAMAALLFFLLIVMFFGFIFFSIVAQAAYTVRKGKKRASDGWFWLWLLAWGEFLHRHDARGGRGGFGGGSFGGGGFGGGSFGGGGASGGW